MKQVLQDRSGSTVIRDVPPPPCPPGSLLVQTAFSVISSGTERARVELSQKSLLGKARERPDLVRQVVDRARREGIRATREAIRLKLSEETAVGYSSAGIVLEVGEAAAGFDPGDRVACAGGGHASHAEIVSVPVNLCAVVPPAIGLDVAAMTTIAAIALHGIRLADVRVGERVAVVGCGLVGQIACRLLCAAGAEVFAVDIDPARVEQAVHHGASHGIVADAEAASRIDSASSGHGMDEVVITAATTTNDPLVLATAIARDRACVVLVGDVPIEAPRASFYDKELTFRVSRSYGPGRYDAAYEERGLDYPIGYVRWTEKRNMEAVLELQHRRKLDLRDLIEEVVPVEQAGKAYARLTGPAEQRPRGALVIGYGTHASDAASDPVIRHQPAAADRSPKAGVEAPLRVGLIGPGSFASRIIVPALLGAGARLELIGGGSGPPAEAAARALGFSRAVESDVAVISDEVDAVVVATRHETHAALTTRALEAGKHVFCEKPLALTEDELRRVLDAAAAASGTLAVGFNRRFSPLLRRLRDQVAAAGRPMSALYRVSAGELPDDHWTHDLVEGGGRMLGECCHFVDSLAFLASSSVVSVYATGYGAPSRPLQARDNVVVTLTHANGSVGTILYVADGSPRVPKERVEAFSGRRAAVLDDYVSLELFSPEGRKVIRGKGGQDKGHTAEFSAFVEGAISGIPPVSLEEVANVSFATLAIVESLRTGRPVRVDTGSSAAS